MLLASFFADYGIILIVLLVCAGMMIYYFIKNKKQTEELEKFESSLKPGDKVKTYSGFYGEVSGVELIKENDENVRVITLKLGENIYIDVDARAIAQLDVRTKEEENSLESKVAELRKKEDLAKQSLATSNANVSKPTAKQSVDDVKVAGVAKPTTGETFTAKAEPKPQVATAQKPQMASAHSKPAHVVPTTQTGASKFASTDGQKTANPKSTATGSVGQKSTASVETSQSVDKKPTNPASNGDK